MSSSYVLRSVTVLNSETHPPGGGGGGGGGGGVLKS